MTKSIAFILKYLDYCYKFLTQILNISNMFSLFYPLYCSCVTLVKSLHGEIVLCMSSLFKMIRKPFSLPGPKGIPLLGNVLQLDSKQMQHEVTKLSKIYGKIFRFKLFTKNVVVISDAELLEKAFHSNPISFHANDRAVSSTRHVFHDRKHIGLADLSKETRFLRQILSYKVHQYYLDGERFNNLCKSAIQTFVSNLRGEQGSSIDPDPCIRDFLSNLNSLYLIGETLPEDDPERNALWELVNQLYIMLEPSVDLPLRMFPFLRHLPGRHGRVFRKAIEARDKVSKQFFESQKATYEEGRIRGLVDVCLQIQADEIREKAETWLTDDYIKGIMYDTVAAGMTEMMKSLRMLVLLMCHYPDVQSRVQAEIDDVIGEDFPNASHQKEMPYTQAVIFEMLRYVSQTPLAIPHKSNKDIMLNGYLIEKDSGIFPNIWGIHHDEEVWGDPWVFRPDRFLDENNRLISKQHKTMKSFIPFSVGKRRCPGENFAMSRIFVIFAALLQKIHFAGPEDQELPSVDPRLYTNKYPMVLPIYTCRALNREAAVSS